MKPYSYLPCLSFSLESYHSFCIHYAPTSLASFCPSFLSLNIPSSLLPQGLCLFCPSTWNICSQTFHVWLLQIIQSPAKIHYAANACLIPICSLYRVAVTTIEGIGSTKARIHPVEERIARCHGTQCGFCTPEMVMFIYNSFLLSGNLCHCTGYRSIIDTCKTFCKIKNGICHLDQEINELPEFEEVNKTSPKLFSEEEFLPLDPTQESVFPPELMIMAEKQPQRTKIFSGDRMIWISPVTLKELLEAKFNYPQAPVVMGNTSVGPEVKFKGVFHPVIISPDRIEELNFANCSHNGLALGAGLSLTQVKDILGETIQNSPEEKTQMYQALLKHLGTLAGSQIRNMASLGGHIMSRHLDSDLNPLLAMGNCTLNLLSKKGKQQVPLNGDFLRRCPNTDLKPEEILISVNIPYSRKPSFRQAQQQQNALAIVNSGMRVFFGEGGDIIRHLSISRRRWSNHYLFTLPGLALGGKVEFKRTLISSFLFKFYLEVSQMLKRMDPVHYPSFTDKYESALEDLHSRHHCSILKYQVSDSKQLPQDTIGHAIMHLSGIKHATGEAIYCDDMPTVDRELFLTFVTSSGAHAKIVSIDLSEALSLPGVVDVVTEEHLHGVNSLCQKEKLLVTEEVFCAGQLICVVIADSEVQAKQAAKRMKIIYQDLKPLILTIKEAIQHNSFKPEKKLEYGNVDEAFKMVDQILEGEIHMGGQEHFYMKTQSMLVVPKGEDQEIPKYIQDIVASTLKLPVNKVMCHDLVKRIAITAFAPPPLLGKHKVSRRMGKIGMKGCESYHTNSGFPQVIEMGLLKMENAYKFPNLRCRAWACRTNLPSNTALRGSGFPQAGLITGSCTTEVAARCGLPPPQPQKEIGQTPYKQEINPKNLTQCWKERMAMSSYSLRKAAVEKFNSENYWKKKGLAVVPLKFPIGLGSVAAGQVSCCLGSHLPGGSVLVTHGGIKMGQGVHTKMIQVVSRELRMPMSNIHLHGTSTETVPNTNISGGSVVVDLNGLAVKTLLKCLEPIISKNPQGTWKDWAQAAFDENISLSAIGYFRGYESNMNGETGEVHPFKYFVFGAAYSEVETDYLTGARKNTRTDIVMDVGCSINPALDIGQIEGVFIRGMGLYTIEELNYSPQGVLYTRGPNQYKIPAICDIPTELHISLLLLSQSSNTLYSSKGLGESGIFLGCSVFFAIHDAVKVAQQERGLSGPLKLNSPLTPEKIKMACEDKFTKMIPKDKPGSYVLWNIPI
uniref:FAD-binding PCMH-type domain-containing protein n=1 Tax=Canis lupus familiaris TaxID=9615 RepID=A0A8P0PGC1_CANLF